MVFGRVYSIRSHQTTDIYIGSTTQILSKRMSDHRRDYKRYSNNKMNYISSYKIVQYEDSFIELIFEEEFQSVDALHKKEGEYIRSIDCVNRNVAGRTVKEYYEEHKPQILEQKKQYYEDNRALKLNNATQYYEDHKEIVKEKHKIQYTCKCGSICRISDKKRHERSQKHQAFIQCLSSEENSS